MLDRILRYFSRHPHHCLYLALACMLSTFVLLYCTRDIDGGGMNNKRQQNYKLQKTDFNGGAESWLDDQMTRLDKEIFQSRDRDKFKSGEAIPVVILEEHHGVIPYWYGSVDSGIIPHKYGNTLVHIDAHSDHGLPDIGPSFPTFRWPHRQELLHLMQQNDEFIVSAMITGMFSRLIWIYPDWNPTIVGKHIIPSPHLVADVSLGHEILPDRSQWNDGETGLCACEKYVDLSGKNYNDNVAGASSHFDRCISMRNTSEYDQEVPIAKSQCILQDKSIILEMIRESTIVDLVRRKDPLLKSINAGDSWILDIDEDYFGVEAPVLPMYAENMSDEAIDDISSYISETFCAKSSEDELYADFIFQNFVDFVRSNSSIASCQKLKTLIDSYYVTENMAQRLDTQHTSYAKEVGYQIDCVKQIFDTLDVLDTNHIPPNKFRGKSLKYRPNAETVFCPYDTESELVIRIGTLISLLYRLSHDQLLSLDEVGICLWSSIPHSDQAFKLKVCDGFNRPNNDSMVYFYTPVDDKELKLRADKMTEIIQYFSTSSSSSSSPSSSHPISKSNGPSASAVSTPPNLITVVRSSRDGYTPRYLVPDIERLVMKSLQDVYSRGQSVTPIFDKDLFGGTLGWHQGRRKL